MSRKVLLAILLVLAFGISGGTLVAQDDGPTVLVDGLSSPRQLYYTDDGTLYIAEAGVAGDAFTPTAEDQGVRSGLTSQITAVAPDGTRSVVVPVLPSTEIRPNNPGYRGAQAVLVTDDLIWFAVGEAVLLEIDTFPLFNAVYGVNRENGRIQHFVDTFAAEMEQNADGDILASDPTDFALAEDGTLFIADAGCNCIWTWTETDGLQLFTSWSIDDNPVPTSVDFGPEGNLYVGFLSGFPFPVEGTRVERWSRDGELLETFEGFTLVTDVLVDDDGSLFVVELAAGLGDQGFIPDSGRILRISGGERTVVAEGLSFPYGIAMSPDGSLAVSVQTAFIPEPGQGSVLAIDMME